MRILKEITIPKSFKVNNYIINLKEELPGKIIVDEKSDMFFKPYTHGNIKLNGTFTTLIDEIVYRILEIYKKGIKNFPDLKKEELAIFYMIDNVKNMLKKNKIFIIGYKNNYMRTIKSALSKFNTNCTGIELKHNLELYIDDYEEIYEYITGLIEKFNYDRVVLDITNLYIKSDYENTKRILEYLYSNNKKILILVDGDMSKFRKIFGEKYDDYVIDRKLVIYSGSSKTVTNRIIEVLF